MISKSISVDKNHVATAFALFDEPDAQAGDRFQVHIGWAIIAEDAIALERHFARNDLHALAGHFAAARIHDFLVREVEGAREVHLRAAEETIVIQSRRIGVLVEQHTVKVAACGGGEVGHRAAGKPDGGVIVSGPGEDKDHFFAIEFRSAADLELAAIDHIDARLEVNG